MKNTSQDRAEAVRRMLAARKSLRSVSRETGVSRATVAKIANGTRWPKIGGVVLPDRNGDYEWCEGCRAMVKMPCLACQVRAIPRLLTGERSE